MITITKPQAQKRFLIIPEVLQNALFSVQTAAIIDQICNDNHLDEKRASVVVESVGWILLGFLHPEDIKKELANAGVPAPAAQDILSSLDAKIFAALDPALLKAYAPLPHEEPLSQSQPTMVKDINPLPMPTPPKPAPLSSAGWSKMPPSAIAPAPMPTAPRPIAPPAPIPAPTAPAAPAPRAAAEPAPMILHEDTSFKAAEKNASFTLARPSAGADMHMNQAPAASAPTRPAVLEFGGIKPPAAPVNKAPSAPAANAIRYADTGPRSVSQITQPPAPPKPPAPSSNNVPMPPTPPQPPSPQQTNKPIVKDFL